MKVHTTDWHYKVIKYVYGRDSAIPKSLCPYFWKVIFGLLFLIPIIPITGISAVLTMISFSFIGFVHNKTDGGLHSEFGWTLTSCIIFLISMLAGVSVLASYGDIELIVDGPSFIHQVVSHYGLWFTTFIGFVSSIIASVLFAALFSSIYTIRKKYIMYRNRRRIDSGDWEYTAWGNLRKVNSNDVKHRAGLFVSMMNAIRDKVCPNIEVVDTNLN